MHAATNLGLIGTDQDLLGRGVRSWPQRAAHRLACAPVRFRISGHRDRACVDGTVVGIRYATAPRAGVGVLSSTFSSACPVVASALDAYGLIGLGDPVQGYSVGRGAKVLYAGTGSERCRHLVVGCSHHVLETGADEVDLAAAV